MPDHKERPIIFSAESVRAILEGRKTQTRRIVKPQPSFITEANLVFTGSEELFLAHCPEGNRLVKCPYGETGDHLWVRESWFAYPSGIVLDEYCVFYKASDDGLSAFKWRSPIHMPRWASRIALAITDIRVERVQDITVEDAMAEGVGCDNEIRNPDPALRESIENWNLPYAQYLYKELWDGFNAKRGCGWDANPWVWVIVFGVMEAGK
jgi:hypothetical protein